MYGRLLPGGLALAVTYVMLETRRYALWSEQPNRHERLAIAQVLLWPPYVIGADIIFLPCGFFLLSSIYLFSSPNLSGRRLDVYHTLTHGVALVRI